MTRLTREQALIAIPFVIGVSAAAVVGVVGVWPAWKGLQVSRQELSQLEEQSRRLPLLRQQLDTLFLEQEQANTKQQSIVKLIAGSGSLATFIAQLSEQAEFSGVDLLQYEPVHEIKTSQAAAPGATTDGSPPPPRDPLLLPGLRKERILLVAQGSGPQLIDFLRRIERLSMLVVESNLEITGGSLSTTKEGKSVLSPATLRMNLTVYSTASEAALSR